LRVNDGEFALRKFDSAKGEAIAAFPVSKDKSNYQPIETVRNKNRDRWDMKKIFGHNDKLKN